MVFLGLLGASLAGSAQGEETKEALAFRLVKLTFSPADWQRLMSEGLPALPGPPWVESPSDPLSYEQVALVQAQLYATQYSRAQLEKVLAFYESEEGKRALRLVRVFEQRSASLAFPKEEADPPPAERVPVVVEVPRSRRAPPVPVKGAR